MATDATLTLGQAGGVGAIGIALAVFLGAVAGALGAVIGLRFVMGLTIRKAREEAESVVRVAKAEAEAEAQRASLEGEKQVAEMRRAFDAEAEDQRKDLKDREKRLEKREDQLDRKLDALGLKEDQLAKASDAIKKREEGVAAKETEVQRVLDRQKEELLRVAGMSADAAKEEYLRRIEDDVRHDAARVAARVLDEAQEESRTRSMEITLNAIQRYAAEHTAESTVRTVPIPSDDMKGRIIGREGRNIRAIEKATGVDILVDDTPGVIAVSCFDKVRQAIAVEALQKLVADGRVHPSRVEEIVSQVRTEVEERVTQHGKDAILEVKLKGVHAKIRDAMGRLHYRTSYGQNILRHSVEVAFLSQIIAEQLGLDGALARRCGFLHDIGKAMDHEMEGGHPKIGMDFARHHGEKEEAVLNAIGGHHGDIPATTFYTPIVMAADTVSGARPGARRESLERYIQRLEHLQEIALRHSGVTEAHAIQAGREVRVMIDAANIGDDEARFIAKKIADQVSEEMTFPGEIKVTVLRETRAIEYAR